MHSAPPVRIEPMPDTAWRCFVIACAAAAAANLGAWAALALRASAPVPALAALLAAASAAARAGWALRARDVHAGVLAWDGASWSWLRSHAEPVLGELRVMIDLGAWVLLRFAPGTVRSATWMCVSRRQAGARWPAWRSAFISRRPGGTPAAAGDPA